MEVGMKTAMILSLVLVTLQVVADDVFDRKNKILEIESKVKTAKSDQKKFWLNSMYLSIKVYRL